MWKSCLTSLALIVVAFALSGCFALELAPHYLENEPVDIVDGYLLAKEEDAGYVVLRSPREKDKGDESYPVVCSDLATIGWNAEFILVWEDPPASLSRRWVIIVVSTGQIYSHRGERGEDSSVYYEAFLELRKELGVPDTIEMQEPHRAYDKLSR